MNWSVQYLWVIPVLPLVAAGVISLARQRHRTFAASLAIGSIGISLLLSLAAFVHILHSVEGFSSSSVVAESGRREIVSFPWLQFGDQWLRLGWILDPLTAVMLVMVCLVGLLIFIYSLGYMSHDENFTRFFCFLSLFAAGMLGLVIANNLLLFFIGWEIVGLTSYLLIVFWYHKPAAAAAAQKAFITTRIGDLALFLGMAWLYSQTNTLLFYDGGNGCLEQSSLARLVTQMTSLGLLTSTGIGLLIFCGAIGKSGQVPLHVWLPDAMEGPTPVSALIHAATMVAAGVFLVARVYPLMEAHAEGMSAETTALQVVTWTGAITAAFAATMAVAQTDIKRILAYSTVSQLGFMMMGLGAGGVAVGMFHLITHAFFKALLFMGAGSVIHGCYGEQDIRLMGGLRKFMPVTFATYVVGMLALSGFPLIFSGFWSKDEILHSAHHWAVSQVPFYLGLGAALLTAFYMSRQVWYVFFGNCRLEMDAPTHNSEKTTTPRGGRDRGGHRKLLPRTPHESPRVMGIPLMLLAVFTVLLSVIGTPAWPWFRAFLGGERATFDFSRLADSGVLMVMLVSTAVVFVGFGAGWRLYGRMPNLSCGGIDPLERKWPTVWVLLKRKYFVDEIYGASVVRFNAWFARACDWLDRWIIGGALESFLYITVGLSWLNRLFDEYVVNLGFDQVCRRLSCAGAWGSRLQSGRIQNYLRLLGLAVTVLALLLIWGCHGS